MNRFSYCITTHFITINKDYNSCCNLHLVYQMYPKECSTLQSTEPRDPMWGSYVCVCVYVLIVQIIKTRV